MSFELPQRSPEEASDDQRITYLQSTYKLAPLPHNQLHGLDPLTQRQSPRVHVSAETAYEDLEVVGHEPIWLADFLRRKVPPAAVASCHKLEFRPFTNDESAYRDHNGSSTDQIRVGLFNHAHRRISINTAAPSARRTDEVKYFIVHELAHAFLKELRLSDINDFETARESELVTLTDYLRRVAQYRPDNVAYEDFAESFALFVTEPAALEMLAPKRYAVLCRKVGEFNACSEEKALQESYTDTL